MLTRRSKNLLAATFAPITIFVLLLFFFPRILLYIPGNIFFVPMLTIIFGTLFFKELRQTKTENFSRWPYVFGILAIMIALLMLGGIVLFALTFARM